MLRFNRNNLVLGISQVMKHVENFPIMTQSYVQKSLLRDRDVLRTLLNIYDIIFCEMFHKDLSISLRVINF